MSKKSKTKSKERRKKAKASRKAANKARYQKWRDDGVNTKSKRFVKGRRRGPRKRGHPNGACGNLACQHCYQDIDFKPFLKNGKPHGMPRWMYRKWAVLRDNMKLLARTDTGRR